MKIKTGKNIREFLEVVYSCEGHVWLESPWGDKYNLRSELSLYVAVYKLIRDYGEVLELYRQLSSDEQKFYKFFAEHPEVL